MSEISKKVKDIICDEPGLKASDIAFKIGIDRKMVNKEIYRHLLDFVVQDSDYKWYPKGFDLSVNDALGIKRFSHRVEKIRGRSLFFVDGSDEVIFNRNNAFFGALYLTLSDNEKKVVNILLKSFASVMHNHYDQEDFFEEVVEMWGAAIEEIVRKQ
tara:strand:+ start:13448 stop:13918 length:471 start_codon:yes stop_codon:yes gene_type:complete